MPKLVVLIPKLVAGKKKKSRPKTAFKMKFYGFSITQAVQMPSWTS